MLASTSLPSGQLEHRETAPGYGRNTLLLGSALQRCQALSYRTIPPTLLGGSESPKDIGSGHNQGSSPGQKQPQGWRGGWHRSKPARPHAGHGTAAAAPAMEPCLEPRLPGQRLGAGDGRGVPAPHCTPSMGCGKRAAPLLQNTLWVQALLMRSIILLQKGGGCQARTPPGLVARPTPCGPGREQAVEHGWGRPGPGAGETKGERGMRETERRGIGGSGLLPCPLPSPGSHAHRPCWQTSFLRRGAGWRGAGAQLPVTARPERARRQLWAAPGWLLGSSFWGAF